MFSVQQKREISDAVQKILRATNHPELPQGEITFRLEVDGDQAWSFATIHNNSAITTPNVNPHNEAQDTRNKQSKCPNQNPMNIRELKEALAQISDVDNELEVLVMLEQIVEDDTEVAPAQITELRMQNQMVRHLEILTDYRPVEDPRVAESENKISKAIKELSVLAAACVKQKTDSNVIATIQDIALNLD